MIQCFEAFAKEDMLGLHNMKIVINKILNNNFKVLGSILSLF
jgi:hypothetical protein